MKRQLPTVATVCMEGRCAVGEGPESLDLMSSACAPPPQLVDLQSKACRLLLLKEGIRLQEEQCRERKRDLLQTSKY